MLASPQNNVHFRFFVFFIFFRELVFAPHHFPTRVPPTPSFIWPLMPCNPLKISKSHVFYCLSYEHLTNDKNTLNLLNISILNILCAVAKKIKIKTDRICAYYYTNILFYFITIYYYLLYYTKYNIIIILLYCYNIIYLFILYYIIHTLFTIFIFIIQYHYYYIFLTYKYYTYYIYCK